MLFSTLFRSEPVSCGPPLPYALRWHVSPLPHTSLAQPPFSPTSPTAPFFSVSSLCSSISSFPLKISALSLCQVSILFVLCRVSSTQPAPACQEKPRLLTLLSSHTALSTAGTPHYLSAGATETQTCDKSPAEKILLTGESNRGVFIAKL